MTQASHTPVVAADAAGIARAVQVLRDGGLVALPTETVYGLAARADRDESAAAIYRAKGRPSFNPLIVHVRDLAQARELADFDARAEALAKAFWPGPLTLVLPRKASARLAGAVSAGLPSVALRCPAHPVMQQVLEQAGLPLAAPSANASGTVSPTCAEHVLATLDGKLDMVLDAGPCVAGVESTIVAVRQGGGWQILRPGPIGEEAIAALLGRPQTPTEDAAVVEAPGQLTSHYAPGKPVRLNAVEAVADEFHIGFGPVVAGEVNLSPSGDLAEAAARLYTCLHLAAAAPSPRIAIAPVPEAGLGIAINDRLRRAAA